MKPEFPPLPFMDTMDDALRISGETQDNFYVTVFMLEAWLGRITCHIVAEYSEKKQAKDRRLQKGVAKRYYNEMFGHTQDDEIRHIFAHVVRFAEHDDSQSEIIFKVFGMLGADMPFAAWPDPSTLARESFVREGVLQVRQFLDRMCDWVEAQIHRDTHVHTWLSPVSFHPDPETREIACVGVLQRNYPKLDEAAQKRWRAHYEDLAKRHADSAKWKMMGKAMASEETKEPHHPKVDQIVILLWPLVKRHNWTYRELMIVVGEVLPDHRGYPCDREQDLATYCANVLGLRKGKTNRPPRRKVIPGLDVARKIFLS